MQHQAACDLMNQPSELTEAMAANNTQSAVAMHSALLV